MRIINVEYYDTTFILPLRSGSSLLQKTLEKLFRSFEIKVESNSNIIKQNKKIIFVRRPSDRFFSTYFYYNKNFNEISNFIDSYDQTIKLTDDKHILPQSSDILEDLDVLQKNYNFEKKYFDKFNNFEIIKIESIEDSIKNAFSKTNDNFDNHDFKDIVNFIPANMIDLFISLFYYFRNYYDTYHHKNIDFRSSIDLETYNRVIKLFEKESNFFGYDVQKNTYNDMKKFKKILF